MYCVAVSSSKHFGSNSFFTDMQGRGGPLRGPCLHLVGYDNLELYHLMYFSKTREEGHKSVSKSFFI